MNRWYLVFAVAVLAAYARAWQGQPTPPPDKSHTNGRRLYLFDNEYRWLRADQIEGGRHP